VEQAFKTLLDEPSQILLQMSQLTIVVASWYDFFLHDLEQYFLSALPLVMALPHIKHNNTGALHFFLRSDFFLHDIEQYFLFELPLVMTLPHIKHGNNTGALHFFLYVDFLLHDIEQYFLFELPLVMALPHIKHLVSLSIYFSYLYIMASVICFTSILSDPSISAMVRDSFNTLW